HLPPRNTGANHPSRRRCACPRNGNAAPDSGVDQNRRNQKRRSLPAIQNSCRYPVYAGPRSPSRQETGAAVERLSLSSTQKDDPSRRQSRTGHGRKGQASPPTLRPYPPRHAIPFAGNETAPEAKLTGTPQSRKLCGSGAAISDQPRNPYLNSLVYHAKSRNTIFTNPETNLSDRDRRGIDFDARTHGRGNRNPLDIRAFGALRLGLGHGVHESGDVFDKFFRREGGFAHAPLDNTRFLNTKLDGAALRRLDGAHDVHGHGTDLWIGHQAPRPWPRRPWRRARRPRRADCALFHSGD